MQENSTQVSKQSQAIKYLLDIANPHEWISFLFDIQNELIRQRTFEAWSKKWYQDHVGKMETLKDFFEDLATCN